MLNENNIATEALTITVYNYDATTREYTGSSVEFLAKGVGIPAYSTTDSPPTKKKGWAICRKLDKSGWEQIVDHRGEVVYSVENGAAISLSKPGDYPKNTTTLSPSTPYDIWSGSAWATDTEAQHAAEVETAKQKRTALLIDAQATIGLWQTELQLGIISDKDKASLILWLAYIKEVQLVDPEIAADLKWPTPPVTQSS